MEAQTKQRIAVLTDWFAPGFRAGGPIRSCVNFAYAMRDRYDIRVITSDRDLNDSGPYPNVPLNQWTRFDQNISVFYCTPETLRYRSLCRLLADVDADFLYMNSMFSRPFTLFPLWMHRRGLLGGQVVLAPRGMLRASALRFKRARKAVFLSMLRASGISSTIRFHATDEHERHDIQRTFGRLASVQVVPNCIQFPAEAPRPLSKTPGELRVVSVGRIHPIKSTEYLIRLLHEVRAAVQIDLFGAIEDAGYWHQCRKLIDQLPANVRLRHLGDLRPEHLRKTLETYHLFLLPTSGENFGHSIFEAMSCGVPVLISDATPWRGLTARKAGWDIPLSAKGEFVRVLQQCSQMDQDEYDRWRNGAWALTSEYAKSCRQQEAYSAIFSSDVDPLRKAG